MSDRDEDETPAAISALPATRPLASPPTPTVPGPLSAAAARLAAAALQAGNSSAISDIARSLTTALNQPALTPTVDWQRQFLPAIDHTTFDALRQFNGGAAGIAARTHHLLGPTAPAAGSLGHSAAALRGISGADAAGTFTDALRAVKDITGRDQQNAARTFARAVDTFRSHQRGPMNEIPGSHLAHVTRPWSQNILGARGLRPDYSQQVRGLAGAGSGSIARWLDTSVPRVNMRAWSHVVDAASAVSTMRDSVRAATRAILDAHASMHDTLSLASRTMLDASRAYHGINDLIAPALLGMQATVDEIHRLTPIMGSAIAMQHSAAAAWSARVADLMQGWSVLSGLGHHLAGRALHLAIRTRDALINNTDRKAVRQAVIDFTRYILGYTKWPSEARIEAVISALLDDSWLPTSATSSAAVYNPRDQLRDLTRYQHGLWLPLTETKRRGRLIASLEEPDHVESGGDGPACPMDRLQASEYTSERQLITNPVLKRIMDALTPIEREIVWARHHDGARTWADAATMCGRPASEGETVRRKLLKLKNAELQRRSA